MGKNKSKMLIVFCFFCCFGCKERPYSYLATKWREDSTGCNGDKGITKFKLIMEEIKYLRIDSDRLKVILGKPDNTIYYFEDSSVRFDYLVAGQCFSNVKDSCFGEVELAYKQNIIKSYSISCQ